MRHQLAAFTGETTHWPSQREFVAAGHARLSRAIRDQGARPRLAADLGLGPPREYVMGRRRWTDEGIEGALDGLLEGRDRWPSWTDFREARLEGLYALLQETRTRDAWIERYGVLPPTRKPPPKTRWTEEAISTELD